MNKREFKVKIGEVESKYFVREPDGRLKRDANEYKAEIFKREAFKKDENGKLISIFSDQVYNLLKEKGMWTDADDAELKTVSSQLDEKLALLAKGKSEQVNTIEKLREVIFKEVKPLRSKQFELLSKSSAFNDITVESIADEAEMSFLTAHCTFTDTDNIAFTSVDDFKVGEDTLKNTAVRELNILMGRTDPNWALKLPENKLLKKHGLMDDEGNYLLSGKRVDTEGRPINDKGYLINEQGEQIDKDGNRINDDGEFLDYVPFE